MWTIASPRLDDGTYVGVSSAGLSFWEASVVVATNRLPMADNTSSKDTKTELSSAASSAKVEITEAVCCDVAGKRCSCQKTATTAVARVLDKSMKSELIARDFTD